MTERITSQYRLDNVRNGIVHIGLGAFHRAHQAVYIERFLQANDGGGWGIIAANIRSNISLVKQLADAGYQYHVVEYSGSQHATIRQVSAITHAIYAGDDRTELLAALADPAIKIVTLTVTEKGYGIEPASGRLNSHDRAVSHDLNNVSGVASVPGLLTTALAARRTAGLAGFTVLSCDNMPHNGVRIKQAVLEMAVARSPALARWIEECVSFPCSMVDRIVPAMTANKLASLQQALGLNDPNAIETESFSQWVIEDDFCAGRPALETVGVQFVERVAAYETMKLRLLNGSHSLLAYCGQFLGHDTVDQAIADPVMRRLVLAYMQETAASVTVDIDVEAYCESLLARFSNNTLNHRLAQIAMDGSQKIPQRWLAHIEEVRCDQQTLAVTECALACWMYFMGGISPIGGELEVNDPLAGVFAEIDSSMPSVNVVAQFLAVSAVFPSSWQQDKALIARLAGYLDQLRVADDVAAVSQMFTAVSE